MVVFNTVALQVRDQVRGLSRLSEGLVLTPALAKLVLMVWVVKMVGLVSVVAVRDGRVLDAFALQILLLVNSVQLGHQLGDEVLRRSSHEEKITLSATRIPTFQNTVSVENVLFWSTNNRIYSPRPERRSWNPSPLVLVKPTFHALHFPHL